MGDLSKKLFEHKPALKKVEVNEYLPKEWKEALNGDHIYLEELTGMGRAEYLKALTKTGEHDQAELVLRTLVDGKGNKVFDLADKRQFANTLGSHCLSRLATASLELSGFFLEPIPLSGSDPETKISSPSATV